MKFLTHDGLLYFWKKVKSYTDTAVATKANSSHTHTKSQITDFSHNHAASNITGGTFGGQVTAPAGTEYTTNRIRNVSFAITDPGANTTSTLANGSILMIYE